MPTLSIYTLVSVQYTLYTQLRPNATSFYTNTLFQMSWFCFVVTFCYVYAWHYYISMAFNHYAKIKRILAEQPDGWYIKRINKTTSAKNFNGEVRQFDHYYRIYDAADQPIKYCKFQQIDLLAAALHLPADALPIIER
jgi:hypothetical protein